MTANDPTVRVDIVDEATWNRVLEAAENPLPVPKAADKGKYLKANESTGAVEWAEGGSGGGVLVVHDVDGTLDKTWAEIDAVDVAVLVSSGSEEGVTFHMRGYVTETTKMTTDGNYSVRAGIARYQTDSADGYPVRQ